MISALQTGMKCSFEVIVISMGEFTQKGQSSSQVRGKKSPPGMFLQSWGVPEMLLPESSVELKLGIP